MAELVRTNGGTMIHRIECRHNVTGVAWEWAEGRSCIEVRATASGFGYRCCRLCKPASGDGFINQDYALAFYRRTGHCRGCGQPGTYCQCRDSFPCACAGLHPMGSGVADDAVNAFLVEVSGDQPDMFGGTP